MYKSPGCHIHMTSPIPFPSFSCLVAVRMCLWTEWFYVGDLVADTVSSAFVLDVEAFCHRIAGHLAFQVWHFRLGPLGSKHGVYIYMYYILYIDCIICIYILHIIYITYYIYIVTYYIHITYYQRKLRGRNFRVTDF